MGAINFFISMTTRKKLERKPHPTDRCNYCPCPRFKHKGKLGHEGMCLTKDCYCIGYENMPAQSEIHD